MRIRRALAADLPAMQSVSARAYDEYERRLGYTPPAATEDCGDWIRRGAAWVGESDSEVMAVLLVAPEGNTLRVHSAVVDPVWQGEGHGTALLDHAAALAKDAGLAEVHLYTNAKMDRNIAMYAHCGFALAGHRPHPVHGGHLLADMVRVV